MQVGHAMSGCHGLARAMQLAKEQGVKTRAVAVLVPHENVGTKQFIRVRFMAHRLLRIGPGKCSY